MSPSPHSKKVLIAGGGLAGLACSVFFDELGYAVELIEQKPILGGRTYSFTDKKTGCTIDNGQHLMIGAYHETLKFLEKIGAKHKVKTLIPTRVPLIDENNNTSTFTLRDIPRSLQLPQAAFGFGGFTLKDKLKLSFLLSELKALQNGANKPLHKQTVSEWLTGLGQSQKAQKNFWDVLTLATLNDAPDVTSADGLATVLIKSYLAKRHDGFLVMPKCGLTELFVEPTRRYLEMRSQKLRTHCGLKEIRILNGKVQSFVTNTGEELKADIYVSALPFTALRRVLPQPFLDTHDELKALKQFTASPIVSINLFYDRDIFEHSFVGSAKTKTHWFFRKTPLGTTPCHIVGVISGGYEHLSASKSEMVNLVDAELKTLFPKAASAKLIHALINKEPEATLSSRVGINPLRPKQDILPNFFITGDWTQTGLPATIESAVVSAQRATKLSNNH